MIFEDLNSLSKIFSCSAMIVAGFIISLYIRRIFNIQVGTAALYYVYHTIFCVIYYIGTFSNPADAQQYYNYSFSILEGFNVGTAGIYYLTNFFSTVIGLSYLETFIVYALIGFWGVLAFAGALQEASRDGSAMAKRLAFLLPILPGINFWSAMIGKDALNFLGTGLLCWSSIDVRKRWSALLVSLLLIFFVRPHMAAMLSMSLILALIIASNISLSRRMLLTIVLAPAALGIAYFSSDYVGVTDLSAGGLGEFVEDRQSQNMIGVSAADIGSMSIPMRMFSYLFRPLFFDISGITGLVVSLENAILIVLALFGAIKFFNLLFRRKNRRGRKLIAEHRPLSRYAQTMLAFYVAGSWILLANTTANLGLADRQKWMFVPALLVLIVSWWDRQSARVASR